MDLGPSAWTTRSPLQIARGLASHILPSPPRCLSSFYLDASQPHGSYISLCLSFCLAIPASETLRVWEAVRLRAGGVDTDREGLTLLEGDMCKQRVDICRQHSGSAQTTVRKGAERDTLRTCK